MFVASVCDGLSGAQIALRRIGIKPDLYLASEIDKHAKLVARSNYPNTKTLPRLENIQCHKLPKIDLLIGGTPCQDLSIAGARRGLVEGTRSALFFHYVRLIEELDPTYFLLENVASMSYANEKIITDCLGVRPTMINSSMFSAQNRERLYWTNIPFDKKIIDKKLMIEDIIEGIPVIKSHGDLIYKPHKAQCLDANYFKGADNHGQRTGCIEVGHANIEGHDFIKRVYDPKGKCPTLTAVCGGNQERKIAVDASHWRKLTPIECEALQTIPRNYTINASDSQRYKMIGNGFTIDVIAHILKGMNR